MTDPAAVNAAMAAAAYPWWGILTVAITLISAWSMLIIVTVRWQMTRILAGYDKRFADLEEAAEKEKTKRADLEARLPIDYVRREDYIRFDVRTDAKLDKLYFLIKGMGD